MGDSRGAFSFVDRIRVSGTGEGAQGGFTIPRDLSAFSPCLVAEAIGQLSGWVAVARSAFRLRPLAALVGEACVLGHAVPGQTLDLRVELERWDEEAVGYAGRAYVGDRLLLTLDQCVGALFPIEDFEEPEAARECFRVLCGPGVGARHLPHIPPPEIAIVERSPGRHLRARLRVPVSAAFFADHFPRRAVFPATLLLDAEFILARDLAGVVMNRPSRPHRVTDVKLRSFILPGQTVEIDATVAAAPDGAVTIRFVAQVDGRRVSTAIVEMVAADLA